MKSVLACITIVLTLTGLASAGPPVIPEMLECMQAHGSQDRQIIQADTHHAVQYFSQTTAQTMTGL